MTDTKDRQEGIDDNGKKVGKGVDFVDYFTAGVSISPRRATQGIKTWDDLCGKKIVVQRGTVSHEDLAKAQIEEVQEGRQGRSPSRPSTTTPRPRPG